MTLVDQINSLATRSGQEIKAVRNELSAGLSGKASVGHTHIIGDVTGLQGALDAKLALSGGTLAEAANIALGATTGTKIGTATTQKIGFFNATPVAQQVATTDLGTTLSNLGLRAAGTAYPITTSGSASLTGTVTTTRARVKTPVALTTTTTLATTSNEIQTVDATTAAFNVTLPATTTAGYHFTIKKTDASANAVTILGTIDGAANLVLSKQYESVTLVSTTTSGTWRVLARIRTVTATGQSLLSAADAVAARNAIGAGTSNLALGSTDTTAKPGNYQPTWDDVTLKPTTFPPAAHNHVIADVTNLQATLDGKVGSSDPRLTDTRTPTDSTVSTAKLINDAVTSVKLDPAVRTSLGKADTALQTNPVVIGALPATGVAGILYVVP